MYNQRLTENLVISSDFISIIAGIDGSFCCCLVKISDVRWAMPTLRLMMTT
ncbi:hypothetical protein [Rippkaea orientalis]|uniref:hypothetical protein n=1 Tax=Rippkaea orientalis TaxID=2546366 RepID=UPI000304E639|nr:hypothetical protein [Rippkaea orientalis]